MRSGAPLLFLGSHAGNSQLLHVPPAASAPDAAAAAAAADQPWQVVDPAFIESTAAAHDMCIAEGAGSAYMPSGPASKRWLLVRCMGIGDTMCSIGPHVITGLLAQRGRLQAWCLADRVVPFDRVIANKAWQPLAVTLKSLLP